MCNPKGLGEDLVRSVIEIAQKLPRLLTTSSPPGGAPSHTDSTEVI